MKDTVVVQTEDSYKLFRKTINYRTRRKNNIVTYCTDLYWTLRNNRIDKPNM